MKKWTALILACVFLLGLFPLGTAETVTKEASFMDNLSAWFRQLDLNQHGYEGRLSLPGQEYRGAVQQDTNLYEIALEGLGRLQYSGDRLALDVGGMSYIVDLASILKAFQPDLAQQYRTEADLRTFRDLLIRAFQSVVMPYTEVSSSDGLSVHIDTDAKKLQASLYEFIDQILQEDSVTSLLDRYLPQLHMLVPALPENAGMLAEAWRTVSGRRMIRSEWGLIADINIGLHYGSLEYISCIVQVTSFRGWTPVTFSLDLRMRENGFILQAKYDADSFSTTVLDAELADYQLTASIKQRGSVFTLNAGYDPETGDYEIVCRPSEYADPLSITGRILPWDFTARIVNREDEVNISFAGDEKQGQFLLQTQSEQSYNLIYDISLRYFRTDDDSYRIILTDKETAGRNLSYLNGFYLNAFVSPWRINFHYYPLRNPSIYVSGGFSYEETPDGFKLDLEFCQPYNGRNYGGFYYNDTPYRLCMEASGSDCRIDFSWPYRQFDVKGTAVIRCDQYGDVRTIDGEVSAGYILDPSHPRDTAKLFYTPGSASVTGDYGVYNLERITETGGEMVWRLVRNEDPEILIRLALEDADAGKALKAAVTQGEQTLAAVEITPVEKKEIVPVSEEGAYVIDADALKTMLQMIR